MPNKDNMKSYIESGDCCLGIELGSTRIKAVLIDRGHAPIATGSYTWENRLVDGIWSYDIDEVWRGLRECYSALRRDAEERYGACITRVRAMGVSAMMHGYMAFNEKDELLVPFRTWRNTMTGEASGRLTELFSYNIPQRWSIAHFYQAILNGEEHIGDVAYISTLAGYIHFCLTGRRVVGVGEASGMFPIDTKTGYFNEKMMADFEKLASDALNGRRLSEILPEVLNAGENAGNLTQQGALLLDGSKSLMAGIPLCPPEGDVGTGMAATNSVAPRTGNISAGTSIFAMIVLEKELNGVYPEVDLVTTPSGALTAMVHCNNCTSDLNAWVNIFGESAELFGTRPDADELYGKLYLKALEGDADCGGLFACNYYSGEHVTGFEEGRPLFVRRPDDNFNLANFMRVNLYTALGALRCGMDILTEREDVKIDSLSGHGGFFKVKGVGQRFVAAALDSPVTVTDTAGEGGPWGMALLASYMANRNGTQGLADYLEAEVYKNSSRFTMVPDANDKAGFDIFMKRYKSCLAVERAAVEALKEKKCSKN